jgi:hypothetical protein
MSDAPDASNPRWPREALDAAVHEVGAYLALVWQTTTRPRRFYAEWAAGERRALNPLAATLNAVAVLGVWQIILRNALHVPPASGSWWEELAAPLFATARGCVFGIVCHVMVWIFGARRPLRTTLGAVLLCFAGSICIVDLLVTPPVIFYEPMIEALKHDHGPRALCVASIGLFYAMASVSFLTLAIASAQGRKGWRTIVPVVITAFAALVFVGWMRQRHPALVRFVG